MKPIDNLRARVFAALCDDLIEGKGFGRVDALREINRQNTRDGGTPNKLPPSNS
jgi:hypothetical protein